MTDRRTLHIPPEDLNRAYEMVNKGYKTTADKDWIKRLYYRYIETSEWESNVNWRTNFDGWYLAVRAHCNRCLEGIEKYFEERQEYEQTTQS